MKKHFLEWSLISEAIGLPLGRFETYGQLTLWRTKDKTLIGNGPVYVGKHKDGDYLYPGLSITEGDKKYNGWWICLGNTNNDQPGFQKLIGDLAFSDLLTMLSDPLFRKEYHL